jgi:hypothetical protein
MFFFSYREGLLRVASQRAALVNTFFYLLPWGTAACGQPEGCARQHIFLSPTMRDCCVWPARGLRSSIHVFLISYHEGLLRVASQRAALIDGVLHGHRQKQSGVKVVNAELLRAKQQ